MVIKILIVLSYRDGIWLCVLNSCTSFVAGFVVFSVLGFMAEKLGADIEDVALPGGFKQVNVLQNVISQVTDFK